MILQKSLNTQQAASTEEKMGWDYLFKSIDKIHNTIENTDLTTIDGAVTNSSTPIEIRWVLHDDLILEPFLSSTRTLEKGKIL